VALIFSPLSEDVLEGPYEPKPRSVFVMAPLGAGKSQIETEMDDAVCIVLRHKRFQPINAISVSGNKDYLEKIIQLIRGCGFAVAIFSEFTPASTLANIFFEVALCNLFGKPVLLVKSANAKPPSDFVRTEWVAYDGSEQGKNFNKHFSRSAEQVIALADYYRKLGDLALAAEDVDLELAFERYKQALLITGNKALKKKIEAILAQLDTEQNVNNGLRASTKRLKKGVAEFHMLLPDAAA